jgi:hypothetical protein
MWVKNHKDLLKFEYWKNSNIKIYKVVLKKEATFLDGLLSITAPYFINQMCLQALPGFS